MRETAKNEMQGKEPQPTGTVPMTLNIGSRLARAQIKTVVDRACGKPTRSGARANSGSGNRQRCGFDRYYENTGICSRVCQAVENRFRIIGCLGRLKPDSGNAVAGAMPQLVCNAGFDNREMTSNRHRSALKARLTAVIVELLGVAAMAVERIGGLPVESRSARREDVAVSLATVQSTQWPVVSGAPMSASPDKYSMRKKCV